MAEHPEQAQSDYLRRLMWMRQRNDASRINAWRHNNVWTGPELEVASRDDLTHRQVAEALGRTVEAVKMKRRQLRTDPRVIALAGMPRMRTSKP